MKDPASTIRFGTRGSALARAQTDLVAASLRAIHPDVVQTTVVIRTEGDRDQSTPLTILGGRGVFTSALQDALQRHEIDAAVHSAKDLPTERPDGLTIAAFLAREDPRDVFVTRHRRPIAELGPNPVIGTSSRRRAVQVRRLRPDARIVDLRGNIDTRLRKALDGDLDGIVLAAAGVARMGLSGKVSEYLPLEVAVPSPGQGALAVEIRTGEQGAARLLSELDERPVSIAVNVERAFLRGIGGGCTSPVGAYAAIDGDRIHLLGMVAGENGERVEWIDVHLPLVNAEGEAFGLADDLRGRVNDHHTSSGCSASTRRRSLTGLDILVTRGGSDDPLPAMISERGGNVVVVPASRIEGPADPAALEDAVRRLAAGAFDWVVFTSINAVEAVAPHWRRSSNTPSNDAKVAVVGQATASRLEAHGITASLVPERYTGQTLVESMAASGVQGMRVLFPRGDLAHATVPDGMTASGAIVEQVEAYRTVAMTEVAPITHAYLRDNPMDVAIFLSPSNVRNLAALLGDTWSTLRNAVIACIGPVTAATAREFGLTVHVEPEESTIPATLAAIERYVADRSAESERVPT